MSELFKNIYNHQFFEEFTQALSQVWSNFNKNLFLKQIYNEEWENKELKQRMRHIASTLKFQMSDSYDDNVTLLLKTIKELKRNGIKEDSLEYMFIPDFIEQFGLDHFKTTMTALESITQFTSCEFAVRPFILKYPTKMMTQMLEWSSHEHAMVRRLSTEGCRPRLPWAMGLPTLKNSPSEIIPILEILKNDSSESVRRSVANNLNDISKDNPSIVISLSNKWYGQSAEINWLVKHGCRTLLKQGNSEVLNLFGFGSVKEITIENFKILTPIVKIGDSLTFQFQLKNNSKNDAKIRLEYGLYYQKLNESLSKKVFKISEKTYLKNSITPILRSQSFKIITTRKFYIGLHQLSIIINGTESEKVDFELTN